METSKFLRISMTSAIVLIFSKTLKIYQSWKLIKAVGVGSPEDIPYGFVCKMAYDTLPAGVSLDVKPFVLNTAQNEVDEFYQLIKLSKLAPKTYENLQKDSGAYGVTHDWMSETQQYWLNSYDWRKREEHINSFPNFMTEIHDDGTNFTFSIHFAALLSKKEDAIPIVFLHGWPGSFLEFLGVLKIFRSKYTPEALPYHIIVPSLPGYALSSGPPLDKNFITEDIARVVDKLMVGLGFGERGYIAQGGDIGSYTCRALSVHPSCKGIHLNFSMMGQPANASLLESELTALEKKGLQRGEDFALSQSAYAIEHGTKTATIGFVLSSSPIALLAWIGEKFISWTDTTPPLDEILDSVTLYWFTQSFARCIFPYRQFHDSTQASYFIHADPKYHIKVPLGYSYFPQEVAPVPVSWVATTGNLVWSSLHERGGHFAALELPDVIVQDVEDFVMKAWK